MLHARPDAASKNGKFSLLEVQIDTGRTHQIRVHLASLGHPVVGDTLYGAPREIRAKNEAAGISLPRNFLHAAALQLQHPRSGAMLAFSRPLPEELRQFLEGIEIPQASREPSRSSESTEQTSIARRMRE